MNEDNKIKYGGLNEIGFKKHKALLVLFDM